MSHRVHIRPGFLYIDSKGKEKEQFNVAHEIQSMSTENRADAYLVGAREIGLNSVISCLHPAVALLNQIHDAFGPPFLPAISNTAVALITGVQNAKKNKKECARLLEDVNVLLHTLIVLFVNAEPVGIPTPALLVDIGKFTHTMHQVHTFVEAQQERNRIHQFFRQSEMGTLLKDCRAGLEQALNVFRASLFFPVSANQLKCNQIHTGVTLFNKIEEMQMETHRMHNELLEVISMLSDTTTTDRASSHQIYHSTSVSHTRFLSSNSISMLPAKPKIFHGRDSELNDIVQLLHKPSARIAILGAGGMGKTSLAKAALHHPHIYTTYQARLFIICDSTTTSIELAALIGLHIGLKPGKNLIKPVVNYFSKGPPSLLILDNLESLWEPVKSRGEVEDFLSSLTDVPHLALIITMRGAERPAKVRWTRPFLPPLKPLSDQAAHQMFIDIAEDFHDSEDIIQLLALTDNMPLAVDLIAHLVDSEGCLNVLTRWETEKTSLLSDGYDKRSNLDSSITISLLSPRMTLGAKDLLSLLSILPDGLSDVELMQNGKKRLNSLLPIREHMQHFHPPPQILLNQLQTYFLLLMDSYEKYAGTQHAIGRLNQIMSNLGNLHQVLLRGLHAGNPNIAAAVNCILSLHNFTAAAGHGPHILMDHIAALLPQIKDSRVETQFITELFNSRLPHLMNDPEQLIATAKSHFCTFCDPTLESRFYRGVGWYYFLQKNDHSIAMQFLDKALLLSRSSGENKDQAKTLKRIALIQWEIGEYQAAQMYAHDAQRLAQLAAEFTIEADALRIEAICHRDCGHYTTSISLCHRARKLLALCGMSGGSLDHDIMNNEAEVCLVKSEYAEAHKIHTHNLTFAEGDAYHYAIGLINLAEINIIIGASASDVRQDLAKAESTFKHIGFSNGVSYCDMLSADLHLREGDTATARKLFQQCLHSAWGKNAQRVTHSLERVADVNQWGNFGEGFKWTVTYLAYGKKIQDKSAIYKALQFLGDVFLSEGDTKTAHSLFIIALQGFTHMDIHCSRAQCMVRLGDIEKQKDDLVRAVDLWKQAQPLFERSLQRKEITQIDNRLADIEKERLKMHKSDV
ncbi:hypothetical protein C8R44DRAFT_750341 [Mycena epipterygia]|nr:hypothetical protein C8R44DRAFT_750341 [Mycena epipterygia]